MSGRVSVVLVNFNGAAFLSRCLDSVFSQTYPSLQLIVVDNGSTDDSMEILRAEERPVEVVEAGGNRGFAWAVNEGIRRSSGEYVLPLNFDIVMEPDFVAQMVDGIDSPQQPRRVSSGVRIGSASGKLLRLTDEGPLNIIDCTGHIIFRNRLASNRGQDEEDAGQYDRRELIFGASGAAPLYRREMLDDVAIDGQYYDETFFAFLEDVDLDWRAQLLGWTCAYVPEAKAYHYRGGTGMHRSALVQYHNYKNWFLMRRKNDSGWGAVRAWPQVAFTNVFKTGALMLRHPSVPPRAWWEILLLTPRAWRWRREISRRREIARRRSGAGAPPVLFQPFDYPTWFRKHLSDW